jgi:phosphonopyruvate decarboxylase
MIDTKSFYEYLDKNNLDFYAGVPDSLLKNLCACITENSPASKNIITANEGNAVAMCAGYHISTGKYGVVYMQNSGEGNAVNPLMSLTDPDVYSIPLLLIIGWRGEPGVHDEPQHVKQGKVTIPLLEAVGIGYEILDYNYKQEVDVAISHMKKEKAPFALIIKKGLFSPYKLTLEESGYKISREEALKEILTDLTNDDIVVSTTGKTSREIFEIREGRKQSHSNDFLTVGSMGHTASIAYGIALGTKKNVWCVDGDGSFIMHMGGLGVIGSKMLSNFKYVLNVNNAHESVGGQPTCAGSLNIPEILKGLGFKKVIVAEDQSQIKEGIEELREHSGYALVLHTKQGARDDLGRPTTTPQENKEALMRKLGSLK